MMNRHVHVNITLYQKTNLFMLNRQTALQLVQRLFFVYTFQHAVFSEVMRHVSNSLLLHDVFLS